MKGGRHAHAHPMKEIESRLFISDIGGVFLAKGMRSHGQMNRYFSFIVSLHSEFTIYSDDVTATQASVVLTSPGTWFRIETPSAEYTAFVHIDPFSDAGLLINPGNDLLILSNNLFKESIQRLSHWSLLGAGNEPSKEETDLLIRGLVQSLPDDLRRLKEMDGRIQECLKAMNQSDATSLNELARRCRLSESRLYHLFKEETGVTIKQYLQHRKIIKSIHGIHVHLPFVDAALEGGFADQPHFIKIFKRMFGILPSKLRK